MFHKIALFVLILFSIPSASPRQGTAPTPDARKTIFMLNGFGKAQDFLKYSNETKVGYAMGLLDGIWLAPIFDAPDRGPALAATQACIKGMDNYQVEAIIEKYIKDHPEIWHLALNLEAWNAIRTACPNVR